MTTTGKKSLRKLSITGSVVAMYIGLGASAVSAMDLKTAIEIALQSNPEIAEAAANRRAIDFEYEQARRLNNPAVILDARIGPEWASTRTTRLLGNDEDVLFGRQASVTFEKNLLSFGRINSERDKQATRVDAAAHRVKERSELVSLDVVQAYLDVMRLREVVEHSDSNVAFHEAKVAEITRGVSGGVKSEADAQQARERLSAARIARNETEEALDIAGSDFRRVVGRDIGRTSMPTSVLAKTPRTLAEAIGNARKNNPTLRIANSDLDTARAEYRKAKAELKPELLFEVVGRAGDHIGGFRDESNDVRAQLRFRHEFRGGIKSSAVQEQVNRVDEARARIMTLERNVEGLVREAWATKNRTASRVKDLTDQVDEGTRLLDSYQREFGIGRRTLLDILDAEASLFQAKSSLTTARYADMFAQYRLLAATGELLNAFGLTPRREADTRLSAFENLALTPAAETEPRRYPKHYNDTMGTFTAPQMPVAEVLTGEGATNLAEVDVRPVIRKSATPEEAQRAMAAIDALVEGDDYSAEMTNKSEMTASFVGRVSEAQPAMQVETQPIYYEKGTDYKQTVFSDVSIEIFPQPVAEIPTAVLSEATVVDSDPFSAGYPIEMVELSEFNSKRNTPGAFHYASMQAVLLDGTLFLLKA